MAGVMSTTALAAPAALAGLAYLNARYRVSVDAHTIGSVVRSSLDFRRRVSADRTNSFYIIEEYAHNPKFKDKIFLIYQGQKWTFGQTYQLVLRYAGYLHTQHHVKKGEIIALDFMNSPSFLFMAMAIWSLGALPSFLNYNLVGPAFLHCARVCKARLLFIDHEVAAKILNDQVKSALQDPGFGGDKTTTTPFEFVIFTQELQSSLEYYPPYRAPDTARSGQLPRHPCVLIFTSGTTGLPKAAIVPWDRSTVGSGLMSRWMKLKPVTHSNPDRYYTAMPLYHSSGFQLGFHICLSIGVTLVLSHKFSVTNFWTEVADSDATVIQYVGETLRYLLTTPPAPNDRTKHRVHTAFGNGLRPDVFEKFRDRFGIPTIAEFYGATEGSSACWNMSKNTFSSGAIGQWGGIGQLIFAYTSAIVKVDWETEKPYRDPKTNFCVKVPRGSPGEVLYRLNPSDIKALYQGYFDNEKATQSKILYDVFRKGDAWYRTGDVLRFDHEGLLWFTDRIGDTFRWRSENVSTTEVSEALGKHPDVLEANVYGVEVPKHDGRAGCAAVLLRDITSPNVPVPATLLESLATFARGSLPKYAVPIFLRVVTQVTVTGNNKQQKHVLRSEGVDPNQTAKSGDRLFWLKPDAAAFEPFGEPEWRQIQELKVKL